MQIELKHAYLSLPAFPALYLPKLTVITGVNGAGKTHLLSAISSGKARCDVAPIHENQIKFFNWTNLVPNEIGHFDVSSIYDHRDKILEILQAIRARHNNSLSNWEQIYAVSKRKQFAWDVAALNLEELKLYLPAQSDAELAFKELQTLCDIAMNDIRGVGGNDDVEFKKLLSDLIEQEGISLLSLRATNFGDRALSWGNVDIFQQSFARLFLSYFEELRLNRLNRLDEEDGRVPSKPSLTETEFIEKFGGSPWDFVNSALRQAKLDFEIDHPTNYSVARFRPTLRKSSSGKELQFRELSSGEQILMSLAFCIYNTDNEWQTINHPKLILFDEIDATLHPSMSRRTVEIIEKFLVEMLGIHVIMTTHSPATVAVCPEESLYAMRPSQPGLEKVSKQQAISLLTAEIPTLSINFDGRRQVFAESQYDAGLFSTLYGILRPLLESERSLEFIGVGGQSRNGDVSSGCDQVRRIVNDLAKCGNTSAFGVIDWDLRNKENDRLFVLAEKDRYSIENCLLDPLLLAALLIREKRANYKRFGLDEDVTYPNFGKVSQSQKQSAIDYIQRTVLSDEGLENDLAIDYIDGASQKASSKYLHLNGHQLEERVKNAFPELKRFQNKGQLLEEIANSVARDHRELLPKSILNTFNSILKYEFK